jgi:tetratricopeptide (TPR) repeat protein
LPIPPDGGDGVEVDDNGAGTGGEANDGGARVDGAKGDGAKGGDALPPAVFTLPDGTRVTITGRPGQTITVPPQGGTNGADDDDDDAENDAVERDPHHIKAEEYAAEGKWPQAEVEYRAALKAHPASSECWNDLGNAFFEQGKWQDAEKAHRAAVRLDPKESFFHAQLALDLLRQNRKPEALKEANEAKRLGLEDHEVFDELETKTE